MQMFSVRKPKQPLLFSLLVGGGLAAMLMAGCTVAAAAALPAAVLADEPNRQRQQDKNHDHHNYTCHFQIASIHYYTTKICGGQVYILCAAAHTTRSRKEATVYGKYRCYLRCVQLCTS